MGGKIVDAAIRHDFETVDSKVAEAEFFLQKMARVGSNLFEFNCYFSAYLAASRTTTLALQRFDNIPGFSEWYEPQRARMKSSRLAKLFLDLRNAHLHGGPHAVTWWAQQRGKINYGLHRSVLLSEGPVDNVVAVCRDHFVLLLSIVYDCYVELGVHIDPQQYFSRENFDAMSKTIENAEIEVWGWIRTSLIEEGYDEDSRWAELRAEVGECTINHLFYSYLGVSTPQPEMPDYFEDFAYTPEEKGWVHVPAGFESIEDYRAAQGMARTDSMDKSPPA